MMTREEKQQLLEKWLDTFPLVRRYCSMKKEMDERTLREARDAFFEKAKQKGSRCPCCDRFGRVYRRSMHSSMAAVLVVMYRNTPPDKYVHVAKLINSYLIAGGDFAKLRYWGLIEEAPGEVIAGKSSMGMWRVTDLGRLFVEGKRTVQKYCWMYNSEALGFDGEYIDIHDALANKFDYRKLMG